MKTIKYLIIMISVYNLILTGCTKTEIIPTVPTSTCTACNTQPAYELLLEKYSPSDATTMYIATLKGDFIYPVAVKWFANYSGHQVLNRIDTLTLPSGNKSFYLGGGFPQVDCEVTMSNGATITKSIRY